jgi:DNA-binding transcriptional regulator GbsR (MarR family)
VKPAGRRAAGSDEDRISRKSFVSFFIETPGPMRQPAREKMSSIADKAVGKDVRLSGLDIEAIEMFISFFKLIGLPKSVGEIYGLLFVATRPLSMEDLMDRLEISLGAASQGLKLLRSVGAVKVVYAPGERRDHYVADLELSKFATSFIKEEMKPRLERALQRVERMEGFAEEMSPKDRKVAFERIDRLKHWMERGQKMMPWILKFLVK